MLVLMVGCALFQEEEVIYLTDAKDDMQAKTRSSAGWAFPGSCSRY